MRIDGADVELRETAGWRDRRHVGDHGSIVARAGKVAVKR
jgi:hypothetical protein